MQGEGFYLPAVEREADRADREVWRSIRSDDRGLEDLTGRQVAVVAILRGKVVRVVFVHSNYTDAVETLRDLYHRVPRVWWDLRGPGGKPLSWRLDG